MITGSKLFHVGFGKACNASSWTYLEGQINVTDLASVTELFLYISGAPPGTDIYVDDVVMQAAPANNLDSDEDGIQDSWEMYYFGSLENASMDTDYNNNSFRMELNFGKRFMVVMGSLLPSIINPTLAMLNNQVNLSWPSENGTMYRILCSTNLALGEWNVVSNAIAGNDQMMSVVMPTTNEVEFIQVEAGSINAIFAKMFH